MRNIKIKNKILNHLTLNGSKHTSEKKFYQTIKEINKKYLKVTKELIRLTIIKSSPVFKLHIIKLKRKKKKKVIEVPTFLSNLKRRTSLAIKLIVFSIRKKKVSLYDEIIDTLKNNSATINKKIDMQNQVLKKRRYFSFFRW